MDNNAIIGFSLMAVFALIYLLFRKNPEITAYSEGKRFRCVLPIYMLSGKAVSIVGYSELPHLELGDFIRYCDAIEDTGAEYLIKHEKYTYFPKNAVCKVECWCEEVD